MLNSKLSGDRKILTKRTDGQTFPVPLKTSDESLNFLRTALDRAEPVSTGSGSEQAKFGSEKLGALKRLNRFARSVERRFNPDADFNSTIAHEHVISPSLDGRTVVEDKHGSHFFLGKGRQQRLF